MRNRLLIFLLLTFLTTGCQKDSPISEPHKPNEGGSANIPTSDISSYDPDQLPEKAAIIENLLANGSFEENDNTWILCGSSTIIESTEARDGANYLELSSQNKCDLDNRSFGTLYANAYHPLNIDSIPDKIHVSFYVKASTPLTLLNNPLGVSLLGNTLIYDGFESKSVQFLNTHGDIIGTDWTLIKLSLDKNEIEAYLGKLPPKWLYFDVSSTYYDLENITLSIDKIKVSYEKEVTQPEPMPSNLLNYPGNDEILFINSDTQVASTMKLNGSNLVNYDNISTEVISSIPYWFDDKQITLGKTVFNPLPNTDSQIIPNSQTELYRINLATGDETLLFETLGSPGRFEFDGSIYNQDALDLEVKRVAWDAYRKRGALTVCGNNRSLSNVSDDYCVIYIIDENGKVLSSDTEGFNAAWSSTGKLSYVNGSYLKVADVSNDGTIHSNIVYESNSDLFDVVDWSPDGNSLVFMERGGDFVGSTYAKAIKTINITTGKIKELVLVDHGSAYPNVSWSNDGNYIIYSLFIPSKADSNLGNNQIWWVEIATSKTGPITTNINAFGGTFRKQF
ncbi:PD40 domain-containing protein [Aurantibacter crassamenti]|uniref:PD40 domain-containing protein n=1 Tax=Aurantibacter crassamenti TaxID=1837375 RepID=UPI001939A359|nr:PD40 domain-containing protein [Aurantibacter crassamenti]MBM1105600.1 PD40 domain-containing protein [Aurantibacter crassamenti]